MKQRLMKRFPETFVDVRFCAFQNKMSEITAQIIRVENYQIRKGRKIAYGMVWTGQRYH